MKKLLIGLTALALSGQAFAADKMEYCQRLSFVAEQIMDVRQMGEPIETVQMIKTDLQEFNITVEYAYELPVVEGENEKLLATIKFKRSVYNICMTSKKI